MTPKYLIHIAIALSCLAIAGCGDDSNSSQQPPECTDGQVLNTETGKCEPAAKPECTSNDDCTDGKICMDGKCNPSFAAPECTSDGDCTDGKVCTSGKCENPQTKPECTTNGDCKDGKVCKDGTCQTKPECLEDRDCAKGKVCTEGACTAPQTTEPECSLDEDCPQPQICRDEKCVYECEADGDCNGELVCKDHRCSAQCQSADDCDKPLICKDGACMPECQTDGDCDGNRICKDSQCVYECEQDGDCDGDKVCADHRCKIECETKEDCNEGFICSEQKCIPACTSDNDCEKSFMCQVDTCVPDPTWCVIDNDCTDGLYCDNNHCVDPSIQCYENDDCDGVLVCKENKCVPECTSNADCTGDLVCKTQQCKPECAENADCAAPKYCKENKCTATCANDNDCLSGMVCKDKQCAYECEKKSDCTGDLLCSEHKCVECAVDSDCKGVDQVCLLHTCQNSKDVRYPCLIEGTNFTVYKTESGYNAALNVDGSINLCKIGYYPSLNEIEANSSMDTCIALYEARTYDFYGDGIDSNCDGYDYNLSDAIFVAARIQGAEGGDDANSGNYNAERNHIDAKASLKSALSHFNSLYVTSEGPVTIFPDILVAADAEKALSEPLQIPAGTGSSLDALPALQAITTATPKTAYSEHSALIKEILPDTAKSIANYGFFTEGNYPKARIRIYGGMTRNPLDNLNYLHWQHVAANDVTHQTYVIPEMTQDSYVLASNMSSTKALSFAMHHFDMSISSTAKAPEHGVTLVGLSCGKMGCEYLDLTHTTWTVTAPDGISRTGTLAPGANGLNGKDGYRAEDNTSLYVDSTWCTEAQICAGTEATGTGGCGGHIAKINEKDGDKSGNYDGSDNRYQGQAGLSGLNILSASHEILAAGGAGGNGLTSAGISYDTCGSDSSIDESKGKGYDGTNGANGKNGSHKNLTLTLTPTADHKAMYLASNYDTNAELAGGDGAQGGGGGGGAVYQIHSAQLHDKSWISAGSGGNGGCGGKGGLPGGTGGSAIGVILTPPASGNATMILENTAFNAIAGSGGSAQNGSNGGTGGSGGANKGYAEKKSGVALYCDKATAGGNGGNGGGGGAGAGGVAGKAIAYLLTCNRYVTDNCADANASKPCFTANNRTTLANCGFQMPMKFNALYDDTQFGTATAGKTIADSTDNVAGQGSIAGTAKTDGTRSFLTTWIGDL